jgi:hypothetical protein
VSSPLDDVPPIRRAVVEIETATRIADNLSDSMDKIADAWPASRRGSRGDRALKEAIERLAGLKLCIADATKALEALTNGPV